MISSIMPLLMAACGGYKTKEDELHVNHNIKMGRSDRTHVDQLLSQMWKKYFIEPSQSANAILQLHELQEHCQGKNDISVRQADVLQMTSAYTTLWEAEKDF